MRTKDLLLFIPGTMGSCLRLPSSTKEDPPLKLWHERPAQSLSQLAKNPSLYKWNPHSSIEAYSILSHVEYVFRRVDIYGELRSALKKLEPYEYVEFPYDWRRDIRDTAKLLRDFVSKHLGTDNSQDNRRRVSIIGHSMGGLIGALALLNSYIPPSRVLKFISIGTPYYGAPCAFKALSDIGYLPGMTWIDKAMNWRKDRRKCRQILLEALRSFTSTYQLLPPYDDDYVDVDDRATNPLRDSIWDQAMRKAALETHEELSKFPKFLLENPSIQHHFIYGDSSDNTDRLYAADVSPCGTAYTHLHCFKKTRGDGTVPVTSSSVETTPLARAPIVEAVHSYMCIDSRTVELLMAYLTGVSKPTATGS
jgi:pimeloyl-ACP methyl ester carboxylesterase